MQTLSNADVVVEHLGPLDTPANRAAIHNLNSPRIGLRMGCYTYPGNTVTNKNHHIIVCLKGNSDRLCLKVMSDADYRTGWISSGFDVQRCEDFYGRKDAQMRPSRLCEAYGRLSRSTLRDVIQTFEEHGATLGQSLSQAVTQTTPSSPQPFRSASQTSMPHRSASLQGDVSVVASGSPDSATLAIEIGGVKDIKRGRRYLVVLMQKGRDKRLQAFQCNARRGEAKQLAQNLTKMQLLLLPSRITGCCSTWLFVY